MPKIKRNKFLFLALLFIFIGLSLTSLAKKEPFYYFAKSLFNKNLFFTKVISFKGHVLINVNRLNHSKNIFYKDVLVQTGNNSSVQLYFPTKEKIKVQANSQILIKRQKNHAFSVFLTKGNFKVILKNKDFKSNVIYNNKITALSKWKTKPKKTKAFLSSSNILKTTHIANLLTKQNPKNSIFSIVKKYKKYFLYCQANALRKNIKPVGKMLINLHIIDNKITETLVISSNLDLYLQNCALAVFKKIILPFNREQNFWVRYPLYFK